MKDSFDDMFDFIERIMNTERLIDSGFTGGMKINTSFNKPVEIMESESNIYITISLGNVKQEDIIVMVEPEYITFQISTDEGEYTHRTLTLPSRVQNKKVSKTFNTTTGILDITLDKEITK
jgi:HSP20 family molecular chaperone IbpA